MPLKSKLYIDVVFKAKFSWLTALKLRLAGGNYMETFIKHQILKAKQEDKNDS